MKEGRLHPGFENSGGETPSHIDRGGGGGEHVHIYGFRV